MDCFKNNISRWIGFDGAQSAPYFRKTFELANSAGIRCFICAAGFYELYVNGKKVSDRELDPAVSIYDRHVRVCELDLSRYLKKGRNAVGVILGNSHYFCPMPNENHWDIFAYSWYAHPRFRLEAVDGDGNIAFASDLSWKMSDEGPILFNSYRAGETYDARREFGDWSSPRFHDSSWVPAQIVKSPGGLFEEQYAAPVKVLETLPMTGPNPFGVYDAGRNLSGRVRISVRGPAGSKVTIRHAERLTEDGVLFLEELSNLCPGGRFQQDEYILKGEGLEIWESRFDYHGFRYAHIVCSGGASVLRAEARILGTAFADAGSFACSLEGLNKLHELTLRSYRSNFVGFPTDCPHREKNGWTGDAHLASETGLFNYDAGPSLRQWLSNMRDCQRPNGEFPCIIPTGPWGYNWGNGPAWDCAFFVIPRNIYLHTGDDTALRENFEGMKKYIDFVESMTVDGIVQFGLGDWCQPADVEPPDFHLSVTACYYDCLRIGRETADMFGDKIFARRCSALAKTVKDAFLREFRKTGGVYGNGGMTALGTALYFDLCNPRDREKTLSKLAALAKKEKCRAQFGILGAKYVPRILADNGYADLALEFFLQEEYPGWANWIKRGATTLWETWEGVSSRNHIMFGDVGAWVYRYIGGFRHDPAHPGFRFLHVEPQIFQKISRAKTEYRGYVSEWSFESGVFRMTLTVPPGCSALLVMPDKSSVVCLPGTTKSEIRTEETARRTSRAFTE